MKKLLEELYVENELSTHEIGGQFGVNARTVYRWLIGIGIKPRTKSEAMIGKKHPSWKGGRRIDSRGYILVYKPEHPNTNGRGYVFESRLVMEDILERYLAKEEVVHHKGRTDDNRPKNLRLFSSNGEHTSYHEKIKALQQADEPFLEKAS